MQGRWTVDVCPKCGTYDPTGFCMEGPCENAPRTVSVPVVPCDDEAIERAIHAVNVAHESKIDATWRELLTAAFRAAGEADAISDVDSWCDGCGRKHVMRGQVEPCMGCGGNRFVFRNPAAGETP